MYSATYATQVIMLGYEIITAYLEIHLIELCAVTYVSFHPNNDNLYI